ncbi:hypothetical protein CIB48_g934 [Xylaria polymorpha]|nr:hypothetical protein CIB48_g934 [Xylaria polymorpha]
MHRPRGGTNHRALTTPSLEESPNDRNSQRRRQGSRYRGKNSKNHHHHRPHTRKPKNSYSYEGPSGVPRGPPQPNKILTFSLYPRTFADLHDERQALLNALQAQDSWAMELFRRLLTVEADIDQYRNVQYHHQHPYPRHEQYRDANTNVKVKVDGIPIETTVNAERNILLRLGELHVETRCRERWCQVERERWEMRHASELGYDGFGPITQHQQSQWDQNPDQNSPSHPHMYLYQPGCHGYDYVDAGYSQVPPISYLHTGGSATFSEYDCGDQQNHLKLDLVGAQNFGSLDEHADGGSSMGPPASYRASRGQEDYTGEADRKWMDEGARAHTWRDRSLVPGNPSNMRRWSFSSVNYEASNVETMFFSP